MVLDHQSGDVRGDDARHGSGAVGEPYQHPGVVGRDVDVVDAEARVFEPYRRDGEGKARHDGHEVAGTPRRPRGRSRGRKRGTGTLRSTRTLSKRLNNNKNKALNRTKYRHRT